MNIIHRGSLGPVAERIQRKSICWVITVATPPRNKKRKGGWIVGDLGGGWAQRGGRSADDVTTLACCGAHTSEHRAPNIRTSEQHEHNATRFSGIERFIISRPLLPPAALLLFCWPTSSIKAATTSAMFKFRFRCARNPFLVCSLCLALYFLCLYAAVICAIYVIL